MESNSFKVYVRIRPPTCREKSHPDLDKRRQLVKTQDNMVIVQDPYSEIPSKREKCFCFDGVLEKESNNFKVYQIGAQPLIKSALNSFNATIFAYGMTGAGKTFTILGDKERSIPGVTDLAVEDILQNLNKHKQCNQSLSISYLEIYNEQVRDLLVMNNQLLIVEDPIKGVLVPDLSEQQIAESSEICKWIEIGNSRRIVAPTSVNQVSSRSHAILQLNITTKQRTKDHKEFQSISKISLVDLAGSERGAATQNRGVRLLEGAKINCSLLALGNCINILADKTKQGSFVPYRDSKLTRLLKDSLGGNTLTIMLACISPVALCYEETLNTLKYASRARSIKRQVKHNLVEVDQNITEYQNIIESLKEEIQSLRSQLENYKTVQKDQPPIVEIVLRGQTLTSPKRKQDQSQYNQKQVINEASAKLLENIEEC